MNKKVTISIPLGLLEKVDKKIAADKCYMNRSHFIVEFMKNYLKN